MTDARFGHGRNRPSPVGRRRLFLGDETAILYTLSRASCSNASWITDAPRSLVATMTAVTVVRVAVVVARVTIGKGGYRVRKTKVGVAAKVITGDLAAHCVIATTIAIGFMELVEGVSS